MNVLVVDDDPQIVRVIARYLKAIHEVTTATTASAALALVEQNAFDAILCDFHMPTHDGNWFLDHLPPREAGRLIFIRGDERPYLLDRPRLLKPFSKTELLNAIEVVTK